MTDSERIRFRKILCRGCEDYEGNGKCYYDNLDDPYTDVPRCPLLNYKSFKNRIFKFIEETYRLKIRTDFKLGGTD